jgi:predicted ATP-dependent serine protease
MVEVLLAPSSVAEGSASRGLSGRSQPQRLADIEGDAEQRLPLPIGEFARVLGGGVVPADPLLRAWRDEVGRLCQRLAAQSEMVERLCCGIPQRLK